MRDYLKLFIDECMEKNQEQIESGLFESNLSKISQDTIRFSGDHEDFVVGIVDIVNSTRVSAYLSKEKVCKYYSIFINSMGTIVKEFGGKVVKNIGDSLLFYFPNTSSHGQLPASLLDSLYCGQTMLKDREIINSIMADEKLPDLNYRISMDYGIITTAKCNGSDYDDIFGPPVNISAKINHYAVPNSMVIGGDLYEMVKIFKEFKFRFVKDFSNGFRFKYPVYGVRALR